jgi:4-amino-4-deoxy-L-arabinose transferase-like glycosyltransferase
MRSRLGDGVTRFAIPDGAFGVLLFLLALAPRLFVALEWAGEPVWDGHYYDFGARRLAAGLGYSDDLVIDGHAIWHPWCHYPVGYSAALAAFYKVFGAGPRVAPVVNACIGAALAVMTWLLARHALTTLRARLAGLLVALHPGLVLYSALVMTEPLSALLTLAAFWLAVRFHDHPMTGITFGALVLGFAALVRPQALLCVPFLALAVPRQEASKRLVHGIASVSVVTMIAFLPVLPWTVRNCRVMDGCALVSTNAGWNLAIGAFPRATGRFETLHASDGCREVTGQVQQDRCWFSYGIEQIRAAPSRWLSLIPAKLGYTFDHESFAVEYLREARPSLWPEGRRVEVRGITTGAHRLLVCFAALGCVATIRRGKSAVAQGAVLVAALMLSTIAFYRDVPVFWPLVVFATVVPWLPIPGRPVFGNALKLPLVLLGTTLLAHAVFFGEDRYHIVVTPVMCMLAAAALRPQYRHGTTIANDEIVDA